LAVLTLGLRGDERVDDLRTMYAGIGRLAARTGTVIAGGDIVASPHGLALHVTAIGETRGGRMLVRSGARPGDLVCVSGTLGASAAGFRVLRDGGPARSATTADLLIDAHLRPEPRIALGALLLESGASAAMDLSDGLFGDLPKILTASGVSAVIEADAIPVAAAVRALFPRDWFDLATHGGEDYELLFTISPDRFQALQSAAASIGSTLTAIGKIQPAEVAPQLFLHRHGTTEPIASGAFDHFKPASA
jgi:thiamine-monophosphate kinase